MSWLWGETTQQILFENVGRRMPDVSKKYAWHCLIMDPNEAYKWSPRSCVQKHYYICEAPAGRIGIL